MNHTTINTNLSSCGIYFISGLEKKIGRFSKHVLWGKNSQASHLVIQREVQEKSLRDLEEEGRNHN
jgi:hypothetical protein